jgi:pimeloyl-ACP methyl ester carboxylesterase
MIAADKTPSQGTRGMVHHRNLDASGHNLFYREAGDPKGPTLLLLHGFPTSSHRFRSLIPL